MTAPAEPAPRFHAWLPVAVSDSDRTCRALSLAIGKSPKYLNLLLWKRQFPRAPIIRALGAVLGAPAEWVDSWVREAGYEVHECDYCHARLDIRAKEARRFIWHFCKERHKFLWQKDRRRASYAKTAKEKSRNRRGGRHKRRAVELVALPSDAKIARDLGVSVLAVRSARSGMTKSVRPVLKYQLEHDRILKATPRPLLSETILQHCAEQQIRSLKELAGRVPGLPNNTLAEVVKHGSGRPSTLDKIADAMGRPRKEIRDLSDPARFKTPRRIAGLLWRRMRLENGQSRPEVEAVIARTLEICPTASEREVRGYVEILAGPGAGRPAEFTRDQALQVHKWRHEVRPVAWAEIGRRLGWVVKKRDCPRAHRAFNSVTCAACPP